MVKVEAYMMADGKFLEVLTDKRNVTFGIEIFVTKNICESSTTNLLFIYPLTRQSDGSSRSG